MADPLTQICEELGVCKEEALFYLEGFRWDLNAAMEACRSKTLPPSTENERAAAEERSKGERAEAEERNKNERAAAEESSRNEKIGQFVQLASGSSTEEAIKYLSGRNWNLDLAVRTFYDDIENPTPPLSHDGNKETWCTDGFSGNEGGTDVMQDVLSKVPQFHNASMDLKIGIPPSASTPPLELKEEIINHFREILPDATTQDAINCLNKCKGDVSDAMDYFCGDYSKSRPGIATAQVVKNFSGVAVDKDSRTESPQHIPEAKPLVTSSQVKNIQESGKPKETLPPKEEESAEVKEEHIGSFVKMTGASREDAIANLEHFKWDVNQAVKFFQDHGYSAELISALSLSLTENKDPLLPSMGLLPSQSQFESSYVSSGSMETQRSLEEASSQNDGKAVEEGSSAETVPEPFAVETQAAPSTIMITIRLADGPGTELKLPFRSNQTIRDIHDAIDQLYPDRDRGYCLQSMDGKDYMDWNITVHRVSRGDSTMLFQMFP